MSEPVLHGNFAIDVFDPAITNWNRWLKRFEGACTVFKVTETQKVAYLLHYIGPIPFDLIYDKFAPGDPYQQSYATLTRKLADHYAPAPLEIAENFRFHQRKQLVGETVQQFVAALHKLSINCNFGTYLNTALRNQLVFGLHSKRIQSRLLETKNLKFETAVETASSMEMSEKDVTQLQAGPATVEYANVKDATSRRRTWTEPPRRPSSHEKHPTTTRTWKQNRGYSNTTAANSSQTNITCYRCGGKHLATKCTLKRSTVCGSCGVKGHLQKVCMRKNEASTNQLSEIWSVYSEHKEFRERYYVTIAVEKVPLRFEIDSGAAVTLVSEPFQKKHFPNAQVKESNLQLLTFCNTTIPVVGYMEVHARYKNTEKKLHLYITRTDRDPLLGREWIRQLNVQLMNTLHTVETNTENELRTILQDYERKLDPLGLGIKTIQARLTLKDNAKPVFLKARKVPFKLIPLVEKELDRLVETGILEKTNTSPWATPVVPVLKKDNTVRLCGDFSVTLNKHLLIDEHPLPTVDELFYSLHGGEKFSKIDLKEAYLQMEVHPDDRELMTLNTHRGLYKCARLLYGIASAPAIWQREIENIVNGIPGVSVFLDDIKVTGPTDQIHIQRLKEVFTRLGDYNIHINKSKSEFFKDGIQYCGYYIDKRGVHKEKTKIQAIEEMPRPRNISELRAFLGLINYYGRFIRNLSTILAPLHTLLEKKGGKEVPFVWTEMCEKSFIAAKKAFTSKEILAFYDPKLPLIVACDASSYGVGAVLSQKQLDGTERVIQYASQSLTRTQKKYSQIDKEAYAIIFAIKKFTQYLYGNKFTLYTDHRPLTQIFAPGKALPAHTALRMQHYAIFLQGFKYDIKYKSTKLHGNADALSRLPIAEEDTYDSDVVDNFEINVIETLPVTCSELAKETKKDVELRALLQGLLTGKPIAAPDRFNIPQTEFNCQQGVILRDNRVVVPQKLRGKIIQELHSEHFGVVKMKSLARRFCWWPGIDRNIEAIARNCTNCNMVHKEPAKIQPERWEPVDAPFKRVHIDYAGPFMGNYFFVLIDAYSKWPEVFITPDMTSSTTIQTCRQIFTTFGIPEIIVSDNGRHFRSHEFKAFTDANGIKHKTTAPFHPATNGQAERFIQTMKMTLKKHFQNPIVDKKTLQKTLLQFLFHYRTTPHQTTGTSPAERMLNRKLRTRLSLLAPTTQHESERRVKENQKLREVSVKDKVACRNYYGRHKWAFGKVIRRLGRLHYIVQLDNGKTWKRHINQIRKIGNTVTPVTNTEETWDYEPPTTSATVHSEQPSGRTNDVHQSVQPDGEQNQEELVETEEQTPRRSARPRTYPQRYGESIPY